MKTGVLITNLGTPSAPTPQAVRRYLAEFLHDPFVIELPRVLWCPILHGVILRTRPKKSAAAYAKIWQTEGSPLLVYSQHVCNELATSLGDDFHVTLGMRYGQPSLLDALQELRSAKVAKLIVLPLYPQYASATTGTTIFKIMSLLRPCRHVPELHFINQFHNHASYIDALAAQVRGFWQQHGRAEQLVLSYHGLPQKTVDRGEPYYKQCMETSRLLAEVLGLTDTDYRVCFQSRLGRAQWLQPYLDKTLETLPQKGIKHVQVFCPGFVNDCLETLEEIAMQNRQIFLTSGGEKFDYIPAVNASKEMINCLRMLICGKIGQ